MINITTLINLLKRVAFIQKLRRLRIISLVLHPEEDLFHLLCDPLSLRLLRTFPERRLFILILEKLADAVQISLKAVARIFLATLLSFFLVNGAEPMQ
jgi:hypothetical protein